MGSGSLYIIIIFNTETGVTQTVRGMASCGPGLLIHFLCVVEDSGADLFLVLSGLASSKQAEIFGCLTYLMFEKKFLKKHGVNNSLTIPSRSFQVAGDFLRIQTKASSTTCAW